MKLPRRSPEAARKERRDVVRRARLAAPLLRVAYPRVQRAQFDMQFADGSIQPPAPQVHTLYPPASGYLRFPCPYSDCDGEFDLTGMLASVVNGNRTRAANRLQCAGVRPGENAESRACGLHLNCALAVEYAGDASALASESLTP